MPVLAILLPPLYFLLVKRMGMCLLTSAMFVVAFFLAITVVLIPGSIILWVIAMIPAVLDNRRRTMTNYMTQHADLIAAKMAGKMPPSQPPQTLK